VEEGGKEEDEPLALDEHRGEDAAEGEGEEIEETQTLRAEMEMETELPSQMVEEDLGIGVETPPEQAATSLSEEKTEEGESKSEEVARIMALVEQVTHLESKLKNTRSLNSVEYRNNIKKMRKSVEELQRELVKQELQVVIREVEADINAEEEEYDQLLEDTLGIDQQTVEYVIVALSTIALSSIAWSFEFFVLEEDTSWWWSLPQSVAHAGVWASVVAAPAVLIGLTQVDSLKKNFVDPALTAYLEQNFTDNLDQLKVLLADFKYVAENNEDINVKTAAEDGEEVEDISYFISYLMLDVSILGSELIILLGFVQGLMLKYLGALGWEGSQDAWQQIQVPDLVSTTMGTLVDTSSLSALTAGPFVILSIAAFILAIEVQVNELEKNEPELLSDLLYNNNNGDLLENISYESTVFGWNHSELRPLLSYLVQIKNSRKQEGKDERKRLAERMWGQERPGGTRGGLGDVSIAAAAKSNALMQQGRGSLEAFGDRGEPQTAATLTTSSDLAARRLSMWQLNFHAKKKYMWVETVYWIYLTSEVYFTHSLVPSILTALGIECFSWAKLWAESKKATTTTTTKE
jgi:hypothetical protein